MGLPSFTRTLTSTYWGRRVLGADAVPRVFSLPFRSYLVRPDSDINVCTSTRACTVTRRK